MGSPKRISSRMQPKYMTLEYCFILMSLNCMFSGFEFLILFLVPNKMHFVLSSPKCILHSLSANQSQCRWNVYLAPFQFRQYLYAEILSKCHQHIVIIHSQHFVAYHLFITEKGVVLKCNLHGRFPGSEKVFLIWNLSFLFGR